jgi:hypothetical protein
MGYRVRDVPDESEHDHTTDHDAGGAPPPLFTTPSGKHAAILFGRFLLRGLLHTHGSAGRVGAIFRKSIRL